jgi:transposase
MFRTKDTQMSLLELQYYLPEKLQEGLRASWAHAFRSDIMPAIPEEEFRGLYAEDEGRPCVPVAILIGLSVIKENFQCTDSRLIEALQYDLLVQYALRVDPFQAQISIRTIYNFRERVMSSPALKETFFAILDEIINKASIKTSFQRLDSKHFRSNMAKLARLQLFVRTIEKFLRSLGAGDLATVSEDLRKRYMEREGYFADVSPRDAKRNLDQAAKDILTLLTLFGGNDAVISTEAFGLLERLFVEQCYRPSEFEAFPRPADEIPSDSLQNPSDPDAAYSRHKGEGYQVQIAETCNADNPLQVVTDFEVQKANVSDFKSLQPVIESLDERGHKPDIIAADAGYVSGENIVACEEQGVSLLGPAATGRPAQNEKTSLAEFEVGINDRICGCPEGAKPIYCSEREDGSFLVQFDSERCRQCDKRDRCPVSKRGRLTYTKPELVLACRKKEQRAPEFKDAYKIRSGIEATNSDLNTAHGARKVWTRGVHRVSLAMTFKIMALNVRRYTQYAAGVIRRKMNGLNISQETYVLSSA